MPRQFFADLPGFPAWCCGTCGIMYLIIDILGNMYKMRNTMPARNPAIATMAADKLIALGEKIRAHRKALHISATTAAEAAGLSRVTLHRIENGAPAVTIGAYFNAMAALKLDFGIFEPADLATEGPDADREGWS